MQRQIVVAVLTTFCVAACANAPPPIARNLPSVFAAAQPVFNQRVKERFPVGSHEQTLLAELRREGFTLSPKNVAPTPSKSEAVYTVHRVACRRDWRILWSANDGKITAISGRYGAACL
jgi:hypothetical protein